MELARSYRVLGLRMDADYPEIRLAYRRLALKYHPDRNSGPEATKTFETINEAYNTIIGSPVIAGRSTPVNNNEEHEQEGGKMAFTILTDKERVYHVSPMRFESEVRRHFNPSLDSGIYCKVGNKWFEISGGPRSSWSPIKWGSKGGGLIEWGSGRDKDDWKSVKWDDFWSYIRRQAAAAVPRQEATVASSS